MTQRTTRIRWNEEERSTLLAAYQQLRLHDPAAGVADLFAAAQKALPRQRRRALDYQLRAWLEGASKGVGAPRRVAAANAVATAAAATVPSGGRKRGKGALPPPVTMAAKASAAPEPAPPPGARAAQSVAPNSAAIAKVMVELGSEIVAEILESTRVQQALSALLRAAWPANAPAAPLPPLVPATAAPTAAAPRAPEPGAVHAAVPANGKLRVLVAGIEQREGAVLAKTYDDTLELACWSAADGPDRLSEAVARADVMVGMTGLLSQPVEQTLRRQAKHYLSNARGVAGLRSELAGLALSGHGAGGG
jgi:hypothetical protein